MRKVLYYIAFYLIGFIWMGCGIMAFGFAAAPAAFDAPVTESYIKAAAWSAMYFALLGVLCRMEVKRDASIFRK